jgi:hypothetical protein
MGRILTRLSSLCSTGARQRKQPSKLEEGGSFDDDDDDEAFPDGDDGSKDEEESDLERFIRTRIFRVDDKAYIQDQDFCGAVDLCCSKSDDVLGRTNSTRCALCWYGC